MNGDIILVILMFFAAKLIAHTKKMKKRGSGLFLYCKNARKNNRMEASSRAIHSALIKYSINAILSNEGIVSSFLRNLSLRRVTLVHYPRLPDDTGI